MKEPTVYRRLFLMKCKNIDYIYNKNLALIGE